MSRLPRGTRFRNKQERAEYFLLDERRLRQTKMTDLDCKLWEKVIQFSDFLKICCLRRGRLHILS